MKVSALAKRMKPFLALLQWSDGQQVLQPRLLKMAERLCQDLQDSPQGLKKLVEAIGHHQHRTQFLTCLPVVRATVLVHLRKKQYEAACKLLENCLVVEKEELLKLWNEIHYRQAMEKRHVQSLTVAQRYRCRKRNPPPASMCPKELRNQKVQEILQRFAAEVTTQPSKAQRESLSRETNLEPHRVYTWFANFRRRPSQKLKQEESRLPLGIADPTTHPREFLKDKAGQDQPGPGQPPKGEPEEDPIPTSEAGFLFPTSFVQGGPLGASGLSLVSTESAEAVGKSAAPDASQEEGEPKAKLSTGALCAGLESPSLGEQNPMPWKPSKVPWTRPGMAHKGVQCTLWIGATSCRCCCSCSGGSLRMEEGTHSRQACGHEGNAGLDPRRWSRNQGFCSNPSGATAGAGALHRGTSLPSVLGDAHPRTVRELADNEMERLVESKMLLPQPSWAAFALQPSSSSSESGKSQCHPVNFRSCPEGRRVLASEQGLCDPSNDLLTSDTLWAASWLCEFSLGSHRYL